MVKYMTAKAKTGRSGKMEKRKIFISAHPVDRYEWLDTVTSVIESTGVCTAIYNTTPSDMGDGLPNGVDTLVVLASVKYFTWVGSGYTSEFFAAVRDGIRVIPILIEGNQNTIDLVNMRLGKIQYIDATENRDFAMTTLCAHLLAEERVVDRSLPSVFISYRKQDKKHLHDLVEKIKEYENFDKINLWYDEVIVPGENYSKSILREVDECDLFILVVTPNVLEPSNYVRKVEYKRAEAAGKRIIAIEAEKTDKSALKEAFASLSTPVGIKQSGAIFSVLTELIRNNKKSKNDS